MLIYQGTKADFFEIVEKDKLADLLEKIIYEKMHRVTQPNEYRSWENSMQYMYKVLNDREIPEDSGVAVEYKIPNTSRRIDFLLSGFNEKHQGNTVVVELKQWENVNLVENNDGLVETYTGNALRKVVHPSYQVWSYCTMLEDYNKYVQEGNIKLNPCAYLHNYIKEENDVIEHPTYKEHIKRAPIFGRGDVLKLRKFIKSSLKYGDDEKILYLIENSEITPSKSLKNALASMLEGNREFVMIDDQKIVFEEIKEMAEKCQNDSQKRVYIVEGGPGTGKSVVAVNLMVELTKRDQFCHYVSKNSAPRNVYSAKLSGTRQKNHINNLFKSSGSFVDVPKNMYDTLVVDEAHRLNEKSGFYSNLGENQIKEIINAAQFSVFFIDEKQKIHIDDIGSVDEIRKWADQVGAEVYENELVSQFRCNGSEGYIAWLDNILGIRQTANFSLKNIDYDFEVFDDPEKLRKKIVNLNEKDSNLARILAGYCWEWPKDMRDNPDYPDIEIGDFKMSWNLGNTDTYAIDEGSVHQAGCIHTSQGLEFDYVGVIIGEDMRIENGKIVTDYEERYTYDSSIRGIKKMARKDPQKAQEKAEEIIKNTYRTLMTRGKKGCYVYCVDEKLREYFRDRMG